MSIHHKHNKIRILLCGATATYTARLITLRLDPTELKWTICKTSNNESKQLQAILFGVELIHNNESTNPVAHNLNCILFVTSKCILRKYCINNTRHIGLNAHVRITDFMIFVRKSGFLCSVTPFRFTPGGGPIHRPRRSAKCLKYFTLSELLHLIQNCSRPECLIRVK